MKSLIRFLPQLLLTALALSSCGGGGGGSSSALGACANTTNFCVYSKSFTDNGALIQKYASSQAGGLNVIPSLEILNIHPDANFISVIIDDETSPCGQFHSACVHMGLFDLPRSKSSYPEGFDLSGLNNYTKGGLIAFDGINYLGYGYEGPFPPVGTTHTYKMTVYQHKNSWASYGVLDAANNHTGSYGRVPVTRAHIDSDKGQVLNDLISYKTLIFTYTR